MAMMLTKDRGYFRLHEHVLFGSNLFSDRSSLASVGVNADAVRRAQPRITSSRGKA